MGGTSPQPLGTDGDPARRAQGAEDLGRPAPVRHVAIVTEARSSFSYFRPIVRLINEDESLRYSLLVVSQHLLPAFGYTVEEIEREQIEISDRIYCVFDGYTPATMAKSTGSLIMSLTDSFVRLAPDWVLVLGDRGESLAAAYVAATMNIPVAHVQAGERSGNIDGMTRHAITRFANVHFASGEDAATRLQRMGEEEWRIHTVGAPQLDELLRGSFAPPQEIAARFELDLDRPVVLVLQHAVTEDFGEATEQMRATLEAVCELGEQAVLVFPNSDAGSEDIRRVIELYRRPFMRVERNLPHALYAGLMNVATTMVGNSSSGSSSILALRAPPTRRNGKSSSPSTTSPSCPSWTTRTASWTYSSPSSRSECRGRRVPRRPAGTPSAVITDARSGVVRPR